MVKVLTIRDPKTGKLIAEQQIAPTEDEDVAVARLYRKTLDSGAPEYQVQSKSVWQEDRDWAAELARNFSGFRLVVLGPKGASGLGKSSLVLVSESEAEPVSRMEIPTEKQLLDDTIRGRRREAVVPIKKEELPGVGDTVTFVESRSDPFGVPYLPSNGTAVSVDLSELIDLDYKWADRNLYRIAWDPKTARVRPKSSALH
jgi:hypothetical protein